MKTLSLVLSLSLMFSLPAHAQSAQQGPDSYVAKPQPFPICTGQKYPGEFVGKGEQAKQFLLDVAAKRLAFANSNVQQIQQLWRAPNQNILRMSREDLHHFQLVSLLATISYRPNEGNFHVVQLLNSDRPDLEPLVYERLPFDADTKLPGSMLLLPFRHFTQGLISRLLNRNALLSGVEIRPGVREDAVKLLRKDLEAARCSLAMHTGQRCVGNFWADRKIYNLVTYGGTDYARLGKALTEIGDYYQDLYLEYINKNPLLMFMEEPAGRNMDFTPTVKKSLLRTRDMAAHHATRLTNQQTKQTAADWHDSILAQYIYDDVAVNGLLQERKKDPREFAKSCELSRDIFYQLATYKLVQSLLPLAGGLGCILVTGPGGIIPCGKGALYFSLAAGAVGQVKTFVQLNNRIGDSVAYLGADHNPRNFRQLMNDKNAADMGLALWVASWATSLVGVHPTALMAPQVKDIIGRTMDTLGSHSHQVADHVLSKFIMYYIDSAQSDYLSEFLLGNETHIEAGLKTYAANIAYINAKVENVYRPEIVKQIREYCRTAENSKKSVCLQQIAAPR